LLTRLTTSHEENTNDFSKLPPALCIATDIEKRETSSLNSGCFTQAIWSKVRVFLRYFPVEINNRMLVDGMFF
jgi:hypothetical protein